VARLFRLILSLEVLEVQFGKCFKKGALGEHGFIGHKFMVGLLALSLLK